MANGANKSQRNVVLGAMAAGVVLIVVIWLAGMFEATPEQPITQTPETGTTTPEGSAAQSETDDPQEQ